MVAQLQQGAVPIQARAVPQSTFSPRFRLILDLLVYRSACSECECVCVCVLCRWRCLPAATSSALRAASARFHLPCITCTPRKPCFTHPSSVLCYSRILKLLCHPSEGVDEPISHDTPHLHSIDGGLCNPAPALVPTHSQEISAAPSFLPPKDVACAILIPRRGWL